MVYLSKRGKTKTFKIHRLVALAFIPNHNNLPQVNHKDENKQNNHAENLEWCDSAYNINYGTANKRRVETIKKSGWQPSHLEKLYSKNRPCVDDTPTNRQCIKKIQMRTRSS